MTRPVEQRVLRAGGGEVGGRRTGKFVAENVVGRVGGVDAQRQRGLQHAGSASSR